jgi:hypothetical protein
MGKPYFSGSLYTPPRTAKLAIYAVHPAQISINIGHHKKAQGGI